MRHVKIAAAGFAVAGALGLATLGIGSANAAPPMPGTQWAQDHGGHGPGHGDWGGPWRGPRWAPPPPPPPPYYGYGGYYVPPPCITGPLGYVHICA